MNIQFFKCHSSEERVIKDIELLRDGQGNIIGNYDGFLREKSSITTPVFRIETLDTGEEFPWARINYFYVPSWGRYYYITDVVVMRTHLYEIHGKVDVLMSFSGDLMNCTGIVQNNENAWNMFLDDGSCRVYQDSLIFEHDFPTSFTTQQFVLAVAGTGAIV